jgi:hypothetical protein
MVSGSCACLTSSCQTTRTGHHGTLTEPWGRVASRALWRSPAAMSTPPRALRLMTHQATVSDPLRPYAGGTGVDMPGND